MVGPAIEPAGNLRAAVGAATGPARASPPAGAASTVPHAGICARSRVAALQKNRLMRGHPRQGTAGADSPSTADPYQRPRAGAASERRRTLTGARFRPAGRRRQVTGAASRRRRRQGGTWSAPGFPLGPRTVTVFPWRQAMGSSSKPARQFSRSPAAPSRAAQSIWLRFPDPARAGSPRTRGARRPCPGLIAPFGRIRPGRGRETATRLCPREPGRLLRSWAPHQPPEPEASAAHVSPATLEPCAETAAPQPVRTSSCQFRFPRPPGGRSAPGSLPGAGHPRKRACPGIR